MRLYFNKWQDCFLLINLFFYIKELRKLCKRLNLWFVYRLSRNFHQYILSKGCLFNLNKKYLFEWKRGRKNPANRQVIKISNTLLQHLKEAIKVYKINFLIFYLHNGGRNSTSSFEIFTVKTT